MKQHLLPALLLTLLAPCAATLRAQSSAPEESPNHFSAGFRLAFDLGVKFKFLGGFPSQSSAGPETGGIVNRRYDDGYNLVDNNNNTYDYPVPLTRNWGYQYGPETPGRNQVMDNRYIVMHSSSSPETTSTASGDVDPQPGFELIYQRRLGGNRGWRWGLEGAFNYMPVQAAGRHASTAHVTVLNDAYEVPADDTGFRFIPPAPHAGSDLAGPLLGSTPTRTFSVVPNGASIAGRQSFDADLFGFKVGVYLDLPLAEKWRVTLSGGLGLVQVESDFNYTETVIIPGVGEVPHAGASSHDDLLTGGYVSGNIFYAFRKHWEIFGGVQYQNVGHYTHSINGPAAELDLSRTLFVAVGLSCSF